MLTEVRNYSIVHIHAFLGKYILKLTSINKWCIYFNDNDYISKGIHAYVVPNRYYILIAPLNDISMFYIKKVHMLTGAIRKLLYGCAYVLSLELVDYLPVHTHKPYNNLYTGNQFNPSRKCKCSSKIAKPI